MTSSYTASSCRFDIGSRSRSVARFVARVRSELLTAINEERRAQAINQQMLASRMGKKRSEFNRQLTGEAPLTLRSIAEISWALGREVNLELRKPAARPGQNLNMEMTTVEWKQPKVIVSRDDSTGERPNGAARDVEL